MLISEKYILLVDCILIRNVSSFVAVVISFGSVIVVNRWYLSINWISDKLVLPVELLKV